jgi:hypothetical protein
MTDLLPLMQREEEQHRKCYWHLYFALIFRGRCLSARNPGSASPVEACHPRLFNYNSKNTNFNHGVCTNPHDK